MRLPQWHRSQGIAVYSIEHSEADPCPQCGGLDLGAKHAAKLFRIVLSAQNKLNQMEKLSISPMKSFLKEGDRKKLKLNNIDDTTLDKGSFHI